MIFRYVKALVYAVDHEPEYDYSTADRLRHETERFTVTVNNRKATFTFAALLDSVKDAKREIEVFVRNWEFSAALAYGPGCFRLQYKSARFIKLDIEPVQYQATLSKAAGCAPPLKLSYPEPPSGIKVTPLVRTVFDRFMGHRRGEEPLASMAYFCLSVVEWDESRKPPPGQRRPKSRPFRSKAAATYAVGIDVLDKIGSLSSEKGGTQARKAVGVGKALDEEERTFLAEATQTIIRRMAERAHDPSKAFPQITLADFQK